jgi:SAM-dependent methyltransferase
MKKALGMVSLDTVDVAPARQTGRTEPAAAGDDGHVLADALASFGIENDESWAWDNYKRVVHDLCVTLKRRRILEIGGGRDPLFSCDEIKHLGVDMTVNDISPSELAILPAEYRTACFDVAGDMSSIDHLRNSFDFAFSRMVFEHVADGRRAWANLYQLLAPGGVAFAFFPTL